MPFQCPVRNRLRWWAGTVTFVLALLLVSLLWGRDQEQEQFFESRIRPLLSGYCYQCHAELETSGLRLDSRERILKGGSRGPAVVPGRPEDSLLIQAVTHTHETLRMPATGEKLSEEEIADLKRWIREGVYWPETPADFFAKRIGPLLQRECVSCHDEQTARGGLRLDSREALLLGGDSGPALLPGKPEESLLIQLLRSPDEQRRMPPRKVLDEAEINDLVRWVREGAVWQEELRPTTEEFVLTPEQKSFWSFQPPVKTPPPPVFFPGWRDNPVDRFILARLQEKGLRPAPPADKRTLLRRASYDLTGLPPTPEEVERFLQDDSPDAFARVVERLLESPHYGERWGRHWLDVVRYADTAGDSADYPVPQAYLYRDYVIESFNQDKPYDQFIREQLAGDLLPGQTEEERWNQVIATGYLAISRRFSVRPERKMHLTIADTLDNLGQSFLGLTLGCARCHHHKYDPISIQDYYALYGIFDSTHYPFAGSENDQEQKDLIPRLPPSRVETLLYPFLTRLKPLEAELERLEEERKAAMGRSTQVTTTRTVEEIRAEMKKLDERRRSLLGRMPQLEMAFAVAEGKPHNARIQLRGEPDQLAEEVPRRFLQILGGQELPAWARGSGRLQLAEWLTHPQNPLTARVMVNRIWQHHFSRGLVATPNDFGKRGAPPSHPELLDYLAVHLMEEGWSVKAMHRLIMNSRTYQQASRGDPRAARIDPDNELLGRFHRRRLDAESIRDSILAISGSLEKGSPGPHPFPHPSTWKFTQHRPFTAVYESRHRSVYLMTQRIQRHPYLSLFDGADANSTTPVRTVTTTPIQALFMMNSEFVHEQSKALADRLIRESPREEHLDRLHRLIWARSPDPEERRQGEEYLRLARKAAGQGLSEEEGYRQALAGYARVLFASNEFLFVD